MLLGCFDSSIHYATDAKVLIQQALLQKPEGWQRMEGAGDISSLSVA